MNQRRWKRPLGCPKTAAREAGSRLRSKSQAVQSGTAGGKADIRHLSSGVHFFACAHLQQCNGADLRLWRNVFLEERKRGVRVRRFGWTWYPLRRDPKDAGKGFRFSLLHHCIHSGVHTFRPAALKVCVIEELGAWRDDGAGVAGAGHGDDDDHGGDGRSCVRRLRRLSQEVCRKRSTAAPEEAAGGGGISGQEG